ncbi:MAG: hypothetical protein HHAS10_08910 [Candidatus Altimarinota bacterium]
MITERISSSPSFWQSNIWEAILHDSGQTRDVEVITYGQYGIMVEYRSIGLGFEGAFSLGVDMGQYTEEFLQRVRDELASKGVIFWQIEEYYPDGVDPTQAHQVVYGRNFIEPWTRVLDLRKTEEELMAEMHEKGRYNIRLAWKRGVLIEWVRPIAENIDIWMKLLSETTERDDFAHNSHEYYISFLRNITDANAGGMVFASYEGKIIAAGVFIFHHGTALYYYGASTSDPEMRKHMAPYLIQWEGIREGKLRGCHTYDFLGVCLPEDAEHHLAGVSSFKEKFGGKIIMVGGKSLYVLSSLKFLFFKIIRKMKKGLHK